jgi:thymidylate kinase
VTLTGRNQLAERVRALVLERGEHISATAETLLMFGARQVHVDNLIRPALTRSSGCCVIASPMRRMPTRAAAAASTTKLIDLDRARGTR